MASTVINNPEDVRNYYTKIENYIGSLRDDFTKTENAIKTVSESWKDDQFKQFQNNFNEDKEKIEPLCRLLERYVELLKDLERKLEGYMCSPMSCNF